MQVPSCSQIRMLTTSATRWVCRWMTFCPEWLIGSPNLNTSNPLYLWVYLAVSPPVRIVVLARSPHVLLVHESLVRSHVLLWHWLICLSQMGLHPVVAHGRFVRVYCWHAPAGPEEFRQKGRVTCCLLPCYCAVISGCDLYNDLVYIGIHSIYCD